jgi:hypothetical protein
MIMEMMSVKDVPTKLTLLLHLDAGTILGIGVMKGRRAILIFGLNSRVSKLEQS